MAGLLAENDHQGTAQLRMETLMAEDAFERTMSALREAETHAQGEAPAGIVVYVPETVDVVGIRKRTGKAQPAFAASIGVPLSTLRQWEHQRRQPQGAARVLLAMLEKNPQVVEQTLGAEAPVAARAEAVGAG